MAYKKYPRKVKYMINKIQDAMLFPSLKIPRTTAKHWLTNEIPDGATLEMSPIEQDLFIL